MSGVVKVHALVEPAGPLFGLVHLVSPVPGIEWRGPRTSVPTWCGGMATGEALVWHLPGRGSGRLDVLPETRRICAGCFGATYRAMWAATFGGDPP